jgi:hypothetical protein
MGHQHLPTGHTLFVVLYVYDAAGQPQWVVMPEAAGTPRARLQRRALHPLVLLVRELRREPLQPGPRVATASLEFSGTGAATLRLHHQRRVSGAKPITRQGFGDGAAIVQ